MSSFLGWSGWSTLTLVAATGALVGCVAFVVRYVTVTGGAWRDEPEGRWMVYGRAIIAALLALVIVNRLWPGWAARGAVTFVFMALFAVQAYWPLVLVNRAHRGHDHHRGVIMQDGKGKIEWKTRVQALVTFVVASAGLAWIGTESTDFIRALPDWLEVPAYSAATALAGMLAGYVAKHRPSMLSESATLALRERVRGREDYRPVA